MALGAGVGPGAGSACGAGALLPDQVGPPSEQHAVELQSLGAELGDALAQVAAGSVALLAVAVPGAEAHHLGGLVVVGDAPLREDLVAGRGGEAVARVAGLGIADAEVVLRLVEVAGHAEMVIDGHKALVR